MEKFLNFLKKIPVVRNLYKIKPLASAYHFILAFFAAAIYGFPSKRMTVIGVTGTKGKTTTCNLIADIFGYAGFKTGLATTVNFRIGEKEWTNETKQTMLGRFRLQKLLRDMADAGCRYAVIETSSEGIVQHRQRFIDYKIGAFTNLSPEHIERHGGFDNYRMAKVKLFGQIARRKDGVGIYNLDDENAEYFLKPAVAKKYGYTAESRTASGLDKIFDIGNMRLGKGGSKFSVNGEEFEIPFMGEFYVYNAAAAIVTALSENVPAGTIREALKNARHVPGRFEVIESAGGFGVVIDYAHEPKSLEAAYRAAKILKPKKTICVLGAQGGGRDKWKRAAMGKIAAEHCDEIILTNEDPYDESPENIIADVASGIPREVHKITDRRAAIEKALSFAGKGDVVVLTGKGGEKWMCVENGKKIPWDEKKTVMEMTEIKA